MYKQVTGWAYCALIVSSCLISTFAYPNYPDSFVPSRTPQLPSLRIERKFAEKPNAIKKVALDDLDDVNTNSISDSTGGFSWSNLLGMVMQMIFNPGGGQHVGPNKSEGLDDNGIAPSPWANLLSVGLKILTAFLGGGNAGGDGIDKVDNGSPMQFINIVVNLLDALKTSFSHRSLAARNLGRKDSVSDATVASIAMVKGYIRALSTVNSGCTKKYLCDANAECSGDIGQTSIFCQLGTYATSYMLEKSTNGQSFEVLYEAGRRGRSGDNCHQAYLECNEV
ncbi:uncharacterized protein [Atheta coriaria]|uniref:uncharacterized protein isoform X4 n=1 Tax=Dalotia coriaria TaxID=877792 RepID=UPI0031F371A8